MKVVAAVVSLAAPLVAFAGFQVDRSVMGDEYWAIWNEGVQAKIDADSAAKAKKIAEAEAQNVPKGFNGRGSRYTRSRLPVRMVYKEDCGDRVSAMKREAELKKLSHAEKMKLAVSYLEDKNDGCKEN